MSSDEKVVLTRKELEEIVDKPVKKALEEHEYDEKKRIEIADRTRQQLELDLGEKPARLGESYVKLKWVQFLFGAVVFLVFLIIWLIMASRIFSFFSFFP